MVAWSSSTARGGLDFMPTLDAGVLVGSGRDILAHIPGTVGESIGDLSFDAAQVGGAPELLVEVLNKATLASSTTTTGTFRPNEETASLNVTGTPTNTAVGRVAAVDEAVLDLTDYITMSGATWNFRIGSGAWNPAGTQRIQALRVKAVAQATSSTNVANLQVRYNGLDLFGGGYNIDNTRQTVTFEAALNPSTNLPWTEAEIVALDVSATLQLYHQGLSALKVYQVWVEVDYVTEPVIASGTASPTGPGWFTVDISTWAKLSGTNYVVRLTETSGEGVVVLRALDAGVLMPAGHYTSVPTVDDSGYITDLGDDTTKALAIILHVGAAASLDSMPYALTSPVTVESGTTVKQGFQAPAAGVRGYIEFVARSSSEDEIPDGDLTVTLWSTGGLPSQFGGSLVIPAAVLAGAPGIYATMRGTLASLGTSLVSGSSYELRFTTTADSVPWELLALSTDTPPVSGDTAGYGSTTQRVTVGATTYNGLDIPFVVGTVPTAPTGFTATDGALGVAMAWTGAGLGVNFLQAILEEKDADGYWWPVAYFTSEAVVTYTHTRMPRGEAVEYAVRAEHVNRTLSLRTTVDAGTATDTTSDDLFAAPDGTIIQLRLKRPLKVRFPRARSTAQPHGASHTAVSKAARDHGRIFDVTAIDTTDDCDFTAFADVVRQLADGNEWVWLPPNGDRYVVEVFSEEADYELVNRKVAPLTITEVAARPTPVTIG